MMKFTVKGVLSTADATTAAAVPIYRNGNEAAITVLSKDQILVTAVILVWDTSPGDLHVYFSTDGTSPTAWQTIARGGRTAAGYLAFDNVGIVGPPGLKIYLKAGIAGNVDVVVLGEYLQK